MTLAIAALLAGGAALQTATALDTPLVATGEHFTLNLLGKENPKAQTHADGSRIFVPLYGDCRILLTEGEFGVTDDNCTDGTDAGFQLPNPDPENDGTSSYRVYVRALGKPGGTATLTACREDSDGTWCSTEMVVVSRTAGYSPTTDVSRETLTVCTDRDGDGTYEREHIFEDQNAEYLWTYENQGLRLAQLRFYPNTPTDIGGPCPSV